jgi:hypothetical protein
VRIPVTKRVAIDLKVGLMHKTAILQKNHKQHLDTIALLFYGGWKLDLYIKTCGFRHTFTNLF